MKRTQTAEPELLWVSHVSLPLTAVALIIGSSTLVATTLILIFVPHVLWLTDFAAWALTGHSPMGITSYLGQADLNMWLGTLHHLYLLPLLLLLFSRAPRVDPIALPLAAAIFVTLALVSRAFLPPPFNVNYAFVLLPGCHHPLIHAINRINPVIYFPGMILFTIVVLFTPPTGLLRVWATCAKTVRNSRGRIGSC